MELLGLRDGAQSRVGDHQTSPQMCSLALSLEKQNVLQLWPSWLPLPAPPLPDQLFGPALGSCPPFTCPRPSPSLPGLPPAHSGRKGRGGLAPLQTCMPSLPHTPASADLLCHPPWIQTKLRTQVLRPSSVLPLTDSPLPSPTPGPLPPQLHSVQRPGLTWNQRLQGQFWYSDWPSPSPISSHTREICLHGFPVLAPAGLGPMPCSSHPSFLQ